MQLLGPWQGGFAQGAMQVRGLRFCFFGYRVVKCVRGCAVGYPRGRRAMVSAWQPTDVAPKGQVCVGARLRVCFSVYVCACVGVLSVTQGGDGPW